MKSSRKNKKIIVRETLLDLEPLHGTEILAAPDLEESTLGAIMLERNALLTVLNILEPNDFHDENHKMIYQAIWDLNAVGEPTDMRSVVNRLRSSSQINIVGGAHYIAELTAKVSSGSSAESHARVVKEYSIKRQLTILALQLYRDCHKMDRDVFELLDQVDSFHTATVNSLGGRAIMTMKDGLMNLVNEIQKRNDPNYKIPGIASGFDKVDKITLGWMNTDLIIIAARPGMGKTSFVLACARNAAIWFKKKVAIFSLEMSTIQLIMKLAAMESDITLRDVRGKIFDDADWARFVHKTAQLAAAGLFIDDTPALSITEMRAKCRRLKDQEGIELIIVDYLQLMRGDNEYGTNREQEISSISRGLKLIAKELNVPVIALSQLGRQVETRGGLKEPIMSDMRESGAIEQDADLILTLWMPRYYKIDQDGEGKVFIDGATKVNCLKNRNGITAETFVQFVGPTTSFVSCDSPFLEDVPFSGMIKRNPDPDQTHESAVMRLTPMNEAVSKLEEQARNIEALNNANDDDTPF